MVKACSPSLASQNMIYSFFHTEKAHPSYPWFSRVPSASNISDWPTRGKLDDAAALGKAEVRKLEWSEDLLIGFTKDNHQF